MVLPTVTEALASSVLASDLLRKPTVSPKLSVSLRGMSLSGHSCPADIFSAGRLSAGRKCPDMGFDGLARVQISAKLLF